MDFFMHPLVWYIMGCAAALQALNEPLLVPVASVAKLPSFTAANEFK